MASNSYNFRSSTISLGPAVKAKDFLTGLPTEILQEILTLILDDHRTIILSITDKQTIPKPQTQETPNQVVWREPWIPDLRLVSRRFSTLVTPLIGERAMPNIKIDIFMSSQEASSLIRSSGKKTEARDFSSLCPKFVLMFTKKAAFLNLSTADPADDAIPLTSLYTTPQANHGQFNCGIPGPSTNFTNDGFGNSTGSILLADDTVSLSIHVLRILLTL